MRPFKSGCVGNSIIAHTSNPLKAIGGCASRWDWTVILPNLQKENILAFLECMKIEDFVTQGTVHIGQLLTDTKKANTKKKGGLKFQAWKEPIIEVDADYVGNFHMIKNMKMEIEKSKPMEYTDWLPCCFGGYFDMHEVDRKAIAEDGIFDCTCMKTALKSYKPAWNGTAAQFLPKIAD